MRSEAAALEVSGVSFAFPRRQVLEEVSFDIPPGRFCVLLGINGAGKTTLFSLITRLFLCRTGRISIFGRELGRKGHQALRDLGVVFQQPTLDLDLTAAQNLRYHCALHGLRSAAMRPRIETALTAIGLLDRAKDKVRHLSGGQRRRLELARALLHQPRLLLADEPTVGLDVHSRQAILDQVRGICADRGVGVLWATHLVDEVQMQDLVLLLHEGRLLYKGTAEGLLSETGAQTVHAAFNRMTGEGGAA